MKQNRKDPSPGSASDRQIGTLLDHIQAQSSIVDRLFDSLPDGTSGSREWDAAVMRRLEAKLADTMRDIIASEPDRRT